MIPILECGWELPLEVAGCEDGEVPLLGLVLAVVLEGVVLVAGVDKLKTPFKQLVLPVR